MVDEALDPQLEVDAGVATITLVDPGGVNALGPGPVARLREAVHAAVSDAEVAALVLRAEAQAFCAGGDIRWFAEHGAGAHDAILGLAEDAVELIRMLHEAPTITIAAVHGAVAGAASA